MADLFFRPPKPPVYSLPIATAPESGRWAGRGVTSPCAPTRRRDRVGAAGAANKGVGVSTRFNRQLRGATAGKVQRNLRCASPGGGDDARGRRPRPVVPAVPAPSVGVPPASGSGPATPTPARAPLLLPRVGFQGGTVRTLDLPLYRRLLRGAAPPRRPAAGLGEREQVPAPHF